MADALDIESLLSRPEGETIDFKATDYDLSDPDKKAEFAKDLMCLANTPREGDAYIVIGIDKHLDGSTIVAGIKPVIDDANLQSVAASFLDPVPRFSYQGAYIGHDYIGLVVIPNSQLLPALPKKPHGRKFLIPGRLYFRRGSQNALASVHEQGRIWEWFNRHDRKSGPSRAPQGVVPSEVAPEPGSSGQYRATLDGSIDVDSLLMGPEEALGFSPVVEKAERLLDSFPSAAARLYGDVARGLRDCFPGYANQYDQLRAKALKDAGDYSASHDLLLDIAIHDLLQKSEPQPSQGVVHKLNELVGVVDEDRRARGGAVIAYAQWLETPGALNALAEHFDNLRSDDDYTPEVAVLLAEAALVDRNFQLVLDRMRSLRGAAKHASAGTALRIQIALADAGAPDGWPELVNALDSNRFNAKEKTYVCLRAGRWFSWNGQLTLAESHYRRAVGLGAKAELDLDVENAMWSLTRIYATTRRMTELLRANKLALSMQGSNSFVPANARTRQRAFQYVANQKLPDAHLWSRHRLLEAIRSGCITDELESHSSLARIYLQAGEHAAALAHALLGGSDALAKEITPGLTQWASFIGDAVNAQAPWVLQVALGALEQVGDLAPAGAARSLAHDLLKQLQVVAADNPMAPALFRALSSIVLEATEEDIDELMRILMRYAPREPGKFLLTDSGVGLLAGRIYRFRHAQRRRAASVLAEMAIGSHTSDWVKALDECGDEIEELTEAFKRVAAREGSDLVGPLSDLEYLNDATRALWANRFQFVEQHPLGERSTYSLGTRFGVPRKFLKEQTKEIVYRYVKKLVAIGSDSYEAIANRANALDAAANAVDFLDSGNQVEQFERVRPLTDPGTGVSDLDEFQLGTTHPLSRYRISIGNVEVLRAAALHFLAQCAKEPEQNSIVSDIAISWLISASDILQQTGAEVLTFPRLSRPEIRSADLDGHANPWIRRAAIALPNMQQQPDFETIGRLASDPVQFVRIRVIYALSEHWAVDPVECEQIASCLRTDQSSIVRAVAAEVLPHDD